MNFKKLTKYSGRCFETTFRPSGVFLFLVNTTTPYSARKQNPDETVDDETSFSMNMWVIFSTYMEQGSAITNNTFICTTVWAIYRVLDLHFRSKNDTILLTSIPEPLESWFLYRSCHLSEIGFWSHLVRVLVALYDHHGRYIHGKPGGLPDGHSHQETCQQPGGTRTVQRYHSAHTKLNKPTDIV